MFIFIHLFTSQPVQPLMWLNAQKNTRMPYFYIKYIQPQNYAEWVCFIKKATIRYFKYVVICKI